MQLESQYPPSLPHRPILMGARTIRDIYHNDEHNERDNEEPRPGVPVVEHGLATRRDPAAGAVRRKRGIGVRAPAAARKVGVGHDHAGGVTPTPTSVDFTWAGTSSGPSSLCT